MLYLSSCRINFLIEEHLIFLLIGIELRYFFYSELISNFNLFIIIDKIYLEHYLLNAKCYITNNYMDVYIRLLILPVLIFQVFFDFFFDLSHYTTKLVKYSLSEFAILDKAYINFFLGKASTINLWSQGETHEETKQYNLRLYDVDKVYKLKYLYQLDFNILTFHHTNLSLISSPRYTKIVLFNINDIQACSPKLKPNSCLLEIYSNINKQDWIKINPIHRTSLDNKNIQILNSSSVNLLLSSSYLWRTYIPLVNFNFKKNNTDLYLFLIYLVNHNYMFLTLKKFSIFKEILSNFIVVDLRRILSFKSSAKIFCFNYYLPHYNCLESKILDNLHFYKKQFYQSQITVYQLSFTKRYFTLNDNHYSTYYFNQFSAFNAFEKSNHYLFNFNSIKEVSPKLSIFYWNYTTVASLPYYNIEDINWIYWYSLDEYNPLTSRNRLNWIKYKLLLINELFLPEYSTFSYFFKKKSILSFFYKSLKLGEYNPLFYRNNDLFNVIENRNNTSLNFNNTNIFYKSNFLNNEVFFRSSILDFNFDSTLIDFKLNYLSSYIFPTKMSCLYSATPTTLIPNFKVFLKLINFNISNKDIIPLSFKTYLQIFTLNMYKLQKNYFLKNDNLSYLLEKETFRESYPIIWIYVNNGIKNLGGLFFHINKSKHNFLFMRNHAVDWWFRRRFTRLPYGLEAMISFSKKDIRWLKVSDLPNLDYRPMYNRSSPVTRKITYGSMYFSWKFPTETSSYISSLRKRNCIFDLTFSGIPIWDFKRDNLRSFRLLFNVNKLYLLKDKLPNSSCPSLFVKKRPWLFKFILKNFSQINYIFNQYNFNTKSIHAYKLDPISTQGIISSKTLQRYVHHLSYFTRNTCYQSLDFILLHEWYTYFSTISYYYYFSKNILKIFSNLDSFYNFWLSFEDDQLYINMSYWSLTDRYVAAKIFSNSVLPVKKETRDISSFYIRPLLSYWLIAFYKPDIVTPKNLTWHMIDIWHNSKFDWILLTKMWSNYFRILKCHPNPVLDVYKKRSFYVGLNRGLNSINQLPHLDHFQTRTMYLNLNLRTSKNNIVLFDILNSSKKSFFFNSNVLTMWLSGINLLKYKEIIYFLENSKVLLALSLNSLFYITQSSKIIMLLDFYYPVEPQLSLKFKNKFFNFMVNYVEILSLKIVRCMLTNNLLLYKFKSMFIQNLMIENNFLYLKHFVLINYNVREKESYNGCNEFIFFTKSTYLTFKKFYLVHKYVASNFFFTSYEIQKIYYEKFNFKKLGYLEDKKRKYIIGKNNDVLRLLELKKIKSSHLFLYFCPLKKNRKNYFFESLLGILNKPFRYNLIFFYVCYPTQVYIFKKNTPGCEDNISKSLKNFSALNDKLIF